MRVRVGCSGYFYRGWAGRWYPEDLPMHRWFSWYAGHFDTVEINASFYRFPTTSGVGRWQRQAPQGFVYSVKAPRLITHIRRFRNCDRPLGDFYDVVAPLADKLGCLLFQMPPSFHYSDENLLRLVQALRPGFRNVVEFRHPSWWRASVYDALEEADVIFCSVHAPRLPQEIVASRGRIYLRLHGDPWYAQLYSEGELRLWAERLLAVAPDEVWVYFNNDTHAAAPVNAEQMRRLLAGNR